MISDIDAAIEGSLPDDMYKVDTQTRVCIPQEPEDIAGVPLLIREFQRYSKELHTQERILDTKIAIQDKNNALNRQYIETQQYVNNQKTQELDRYIGIFKSAVSELDRLVHEIKSLK